MTMSSNSNIVKQQIEEIRQISRELRELVYSAPSQWIWDSIGSAVSIDQIAEVIERIEGNVRKVQEYCDDEFREATNVLVGIMWSGLQTKNYDAILHAVKQFLGMNIDFGNEPFRLKNE